MPIRLNTKFALCGALVLALTGVLFLNLQDETPPLVVPAASSHLVPNGPRAAQAWALNDNPGATENISRLEEVPDGVVRLDQRGQLISDVQLHNAMDSYLLHSGVQSRQIAADKLRMYLKSKLSASASVEAQTLVTRYLTYLEQHDAALGRIRFVANDADRLSDQGVEQLAAWQAQRKTLRQALLGAAVYKEWFAAEDARCADVLGTRLWQGGAGPHTIPDSDVRDCATDLKKSFSELEIEERQWTRHWALYRDALRRLPERDPARRALALENLRQQIFSNDAERQRASTMYTP